MLIFGNSCTNIRNDYPFKEKNNAFNMKLTYNPINRIFTFYILINQF